MPSCRCSRDGTELEEAQGVSAAAARHMGAEVGEMTWLRYQELREAGPTITAEDHKRLEKFRPQATLVAYYVRLAFEYPRFLVN